MPEKCAYGSTIRLHLAWYDPRMLPWLIHHFRISLFSLRAKALKDSATESLFIELTGVNPDTEEWHGARTVHRRQALHGGKRFELLEQPARIDLTVLGPTNLEMIGTDIEPQDAAIGGLDALDSLEQAAMKLFESCEEIIRVAFGGLLYIPTESDVETYAKATPRNS